MVMVPDLTQTSGATLKALKTNAIRDPHEKQLHQNRLNNHNDSNKSKSF